MTIKEILYKNEITERCPYWSRIMDAMEHFGKLKWREAQEDAAQKQIKIKNRTGHHPLYSKTNYKP